MHPVDIFILIAYLTAVTAFGVWLGRGSQDAKGYLLGGRNLPTWAILFSITATETSTVTFLSIPGLAYNSEGGAFFFLQLTIGYILGRFIVVRLFLPHYFKGELFTAYEVLDRRFGGGVKQIASLLFLVMRNLADGLRLFLTAIVLQHIVGVHISLCIVAVGLITIVYTFAGGMKSVIWNDCIQFVVYISGAVLALFLILAWLGARSTEAALSWEYISSGWETLDTYARSQGKFHMLDFSFDFTKKYTFWSGLIGGLFVAMATHGADQLMVQRYLSARNEKSAGRALALSGFVVCAQFALFLLIGVALACFYSVFQPQTTFARNDEVFSSFIVNYLPIGAAGLVIAAVFSAAMSTLSSSLNSSAAAAVNDLYVPWRKGDVSPERLLRVSKLLTVVFGLLQIGIAITAQLFISNVIESVMAIASYTSGVILGVFFLGILTRGVDDLGCERTLPGRAGSKIRLSIAGCAVDKKSAIVGLTVGLTVMTLVVFTTELAWPWYSILGSSITFGTGIGSAVLMKALIKK
jgi:solute:Na+ symporter, SSS family